MKIRALVVDDDHLLLKLLVSYLKRLNFEGKTAVNGKEAVEILRTGQFDICFMDIQMPIMDGIEATKVIREEISKDIPIVAVTSLENFTYEKSLEAGMNDYLKKPVEFETLKEVIAKYCQKTD